MLTSIRTVGNGGTPPLFMLPNVTELLVVYNEYRYCPLRVCIQVTDFSAQALLMAYSKSSATLTAHTVVCHLNVIIAEDLFAAPLTLL